MIKLTPLKDAFPDSGYDTNKSRSAMLLHAGVDYLRAVEVLHEYAKSDRGTYLFHVILPLAHQSIELLTKALILRTDPAVTPKSIGHETVKAMQKWSTQHPIFAGILNDQTNVELLEALQQAYFAVRYAETTIMSDGSDTDRFYKITEELIDAHHALSKIPVLPKHFSAK